MMIDDSDIDSDIDRVLPLLEDRDAVERSAEAVPAVAPEDGEVPPSGVLEPDPTGLGALA